ncbi:MAG: ABC transporter substrate-binding protein, partial [Rhodospirillaceae bacterium]|nr:ABC transporter substrate-binding protein [Rhodospirillaceae bacterium]
MTLFALSMLLAIAAFASSASAQTTLVLDSWRDDDRSVWEEKIAPAFEATHPGIRLQFRAAAPTDYDAVLKARLAAGTAGDLIACRPFDASLALYDAGHLAGLDDLEGMIHFSRAAKSAWQTDDGAVVFCVPVASVIHGFLYNRDAFRRLGLEAPKTEAAFFAVLERLRADGTLIPMALGLRDRWEAATVGYNNIGPAYWKGEEGRRALVAGSQKLTGEPWVAPFRILARWGRYLGEGYRTRSYRASQDMFTGGGAAIYPSGSWEIAGFRARAKFGIGAFRPP